MKFFYIYVWVHWVLVAAHRLFTVQHEGFSMALERGLSSLHHVGFSSLKSDQTLAPFIGRQILNYLTTREVPGSYVIIIIII